MCNQQMRENELDGVETQDRAEQERGDALEKLHVSISATSASDLVDTNAHHSMTMLLEPGRVAKAGGAHKVIEALLRRLAIAITEQDILKEDSPPADRS